MHVCAKVGLKCVRTDRCVCARRCLNMDVSFCTCVHACRCMCAHGCQQRCSCTCVHVFACGCVQVCGYTCVCTYRGVCMSVLAFSHACACTGVHQHCPRRVFWGRQNSHETAGEHRAGKYSSVALRAAQQPAGRHGAPLRRGVGTRG